jgi:hypothetical protein
LLKPSPKDVDSQVFSSPGFDIVRSM